jgi:hypothetical protein
VAAARVYRCHLEYTIGTPDLAWRQPALAVPLAVLAPSGSGWKLVLGLAGVAGDSAGAAIPGMVLARDRRAAMMMTIGAGLALGLGIELGIELGASQSNTAWPRYETADYLHAVVPMVWGAPQLGQPAGAARSRPGGVRQGAAETWGLLTKQPSGY